MYRLQWSWDLHGVTCTTPPCILYRVELGPEGVLIGEVSSFQRVLCTGFNGVI